jgi:tetratricopeptide (TPR) repeat protein
MIVKHHAAILACMCLAASAPAALRAQGIGFIPASCGIKPNHKLVNNGMEALRTGTNTKFADQRTKAFKEAERDLTQAVGTDGQGKNPAAWYYLGRYYLAVNDLAGADSALTKALALAPACKEDIGLYRRQAWVPVFNIAAAAWQAGNTDSAIVEFRRANQIYQDEPLGFIYLANLFITRTEPDSALKGRDAAKYHTDSLVYATRMDSAAKYFRLAVPAASDPKYADERREAWLNVARVYHTEKRYDEAAVAYKEFLGAYPNDVQAKANLADLYLRGNQRDSAMALYAAITAHADSASADDLFGVAGSMLSAIPQMPDTAELDAACGKALKKKTPTITARQISARCQPAAVDTMRKFHALADPLYRLGVQTYQAGLAKNPFYRDALYNMTGISFMLKDTANVLPLAQRLYAVDPMNRLTLAKVAGAWQLVGKKDSALYYITLADSLPVEVTVGRFTTNEQGAALEGLFTNFHSKPSPPVKVTFELVDGKGNVVASLPQDAPAVDAGANQPFKLKTDQRGIVAWRYKRS